MAGILKNGDQDGLSGCAGFFYFPMLQRICSSRWRNNAENRIGRLIDQIRWDMKRGIIEHISIDHILDRAEEILTEQEYDEFSVGREYIAVYQSA